MLAIGHVTILLADEDALKRDGLAAVLSGSEDFQVVSRVAEGETALRTIRDTRPDIAVVDLNLPGLHAIELARRVRNEKLGTKVIILAGSDDDAVLRQAIHAGAHGYLLRNSPARHLIDALSYVRDGGKYFSPQLGIDDRDQEIMSKMVDGIRPILDRLEAIDSRVALMEAGAAPVPPNPRGGLNGEWTGLEARLPSLIEEAVARRFGQMAGRLQQEIEETHVRTLETFGRDVQAKLGRRVSALEHDLSNQANAMNDLREYSQRTEDNLSRLIAGVDKLGREGPARLAAPAAEAGPEEPPQPRKSSRSGKPFRLIAAMAAAGLVLGLTIWFGARAVKFRHIQPVAAAAAQVSQKGGGSADVRAEMLSAGQYVSNGQYALAEDLYKQVVRTEPENIEALKGLASVLFRQDKIEESANILDKLPK